MANFYAFARSNYFRVKNAEEFKAWCDDNMIDMWKKEGDDKSSVVAISGPYWNDYCGWPSWKIDDDGNEIEIDIVKAVSEHIVPGDVAILQEIGYEKLRYLSAYIMAITSEGLQRSSGFTDLMEQWKKELGDFSEAMY